MALEQRRYILINYLMAKRVNNVKNFLSFTPYFNPLMFFNATVYFYLLKDRLGLIFIPTTKFIGAIGK